MLSPKHYMRLVAEGAGRNKKRYERLPKAANDNVRWRKGHHPNSLMLLLSKRLGELQAANNQAAGIVRRLKELGVQLPAGLPELREMNIHAVIRILRQYHRHEGKAAS